MTNLISKYGFGAIVAACLVAGSGTLLGQGRGGVGQPQTEQEKRNITIVQGFWREVWEKHDPNAVPKYIASGYVEHNNGGVNGLENMIKVFGRPFPPDFPKMKVTSQTIFARGEYVLLTQTREISDPKDQAKVNKISIVEMFRVYDGLLQEHWMFFPSGQ
jgi:predicted SnoaL-like aldol condensation-catalyzing enzyme